MLFALLVGCAVLVSHSLIVWRARRTGLDVAIANRMVLAVLACGFVGAFAGKQIYSPGEMVVGISSLGGIAGGLAGAFAVLARSALTAQEKWRTFDLLGWAFPFGWMFGRAGCALVHDHPGVRGTGVFTWEFAGGRRYDLGLMELALFAVPVAILFAALGTAPRRPAFFSGMFFLLYGPFRIWLDTYHDGPPGLFGWTVDGVASLGITAIGAALLCVSASGAEAPLRPPR